MYHFVGGHDLLLAPLLEPLYDLDCCLIGLEALILLEINAVIMIFRQCL